MSIANDGFAAAAEALDMTTTQLRAELKAGKTLKDVAAATGIPYATVTAAALAAVGEDLGAAVAAARVSEARGSEARGPTAPISRSR